MLSNKERKKKKNLADRVNILLLLLLSVHEEDVFPRARAHLKVARDGISFLSPARRSPPPLCRPFFRSPGLAARS